MLIVGNGTLSGTCRIYNLLPNGRQQIFEMPLSLLKKNSSFVMQDHGGCETHKVQTSKLDKIISEVIG